MANPVPKRCITILGSASGIPTTNRFNQTVHLEIDRHQYLLEASDGAAALLVRQFGRMPDLDAVFVSHMHSDHIGGLGMLVQTMQLTKRTKPMTVYMPEEGIPAIRNYLNAMYLPPELMPYRLELRALTERSPSYSDAVIEVTAFQNHHLCHIASVLAGRYSNKGQAYSFRIRDAVGLSIIYSGDIWSVEELFPVIGENGADMMILECAHYAVDQTFSRLSDKVRVLVINHLHPKWNDNETRLLEGIRRYYTGEVKLAYDGMQIVF